MAKLPPVFDLWFVGGVVLQRCELYYSYSKRIDGMKNEKFKCCLRSFRWLQLKYLSFSLFFRCISSSIRLYYLSWPEIAIKYKVSFDSCNGNLETVVMSCNVFCRTHIIICVLYLQKFIFWILWQSLLSPFCISFTVRLFDDSWALVLASFLSWIKVKFCMANQISLTYEVLFLRADSECWMSSEIFMIRWILYFMHINIT